MNTHSYVIIDKEVEGYLVQDKSLQLGSLHFIFLLYMNKYSCDKNGKDG